MPVTTMIVPPKYTSHGIPLEQIEREQREALEKKRYMERKVKHIVENGFLDNGKHFIKQIYSFCSIRLNTID